MDQSKHGIVVMVHNAEMTALADASVSLSDASGHLGMAVFHPEHGVFIGELSVAGTVSIAVSCEGYEPQKRMVRPDRREEVVRFVLGRPGDSYTWLDGIRYPYTSRPGVIAVVTHQFDAVAQDILGQEYESADATAKSKKGELLNDDSKPSVYMITLPAGRSAGMSGVKSAGDGLLSQLRHHDQVAMAGPVFRGWGDDSLIFTNLISVRFHKEVTTVRSLEIIESVGLSNPKHEKGTGTGYHAWADADLGEEVNDILDRLMDYPEVESVSINIFEPPAPEQLHPTDFLWRAVWDRIRVHCPEAWEFLQNNRGVDRSFGDPNILIGIVDEGIISDPTGVPLHEDLQNNLPGNAATNLTIAVAPTHSIINVADHTLFALGDIVDVGEETQKFVHASLLVGPGTAGTLEIDALFQDAPVGTEVRMNGVPATRTWTTVATAAGTATITVTPGVVGFAVGDRISIGTQAIPAAGTAVCEEVVITAIAANVFTTTPIIARDRLGARVTHPVGVPVVTWRKVIKMFDTLNRVGGRGVYHHAGPVGGPALGDHGLSCATIAAGMANNPVGGVNVGVAGSSPNSRMIGFWSQRARANYVDAFEWLAGIDSLSELAALPPGPDTLRPGVDVITCSLGIGRWIAPTDGRDVTVNASFDRISRRGRGHRGTLVFFSAGNDDIAQEIARWSSHPRVFAVAALEMQYSNNLIRDQKASYSCFSNPPNLPVHNGAPVAFCTPSGLSNYHSHNPPFNHWVLAGHAIGTGNRIGSPTTTTQLRNPINAARPEMFMTAHAFMGDTVIQVNTTATINRSDWIRIGDHGNGAAEWVQVHAVTAPTATTITLATPITANVHIGATGAIKSITTLLQVAIVAAAPPTNLMTVNIPFANANDYVRVNSVVSITGVGAYLVTAPPVAGPPGSIVLTLSANVVVPVGFASIPVNTPVNIFGSEGTRVVGATTIDVVNTAGFAVGDWIQIGDSAATNCEAVLVRAVDAVSRQLSVSGPLNTYPFAPVVPVNVHRGNPDYTDKFNGTSSATPLAAGVGALVLAAKPTLTWVEVREILSYTAFRVDLRNHETRAGLPIIGVLSAYPAIDGRWVNVQNEPIVDAGGDLIRYSDTEDIDANPTDTTLVVDDVDDMHVDHAVVLVEGGTRERRIITAVDAATNTITVDAPLGHDFTGGEATTGETELSADASIGATIIEVDDSDSFVVGQSIEINSLLRTAEVRTIRAIPDGTHLVIDPLERDVHNNENVYGGLIPVRSPWYGAGRLDAEAAVQAAFNYNHNARDLMIRNNINDAGVAAIADLVADPIASPDIWGRLIAPVIAVGLPDAPGDGDDAFPTGYDDPAYDRAQSYANLPPHLQPLTGQDYYLYARIANRGNALAGLDAWARFYVYRSRSNEPFRIPQDWNDAVGPANIASNNSGTYFIGAERPLFNAPADQNLPALNGGIQPEDHFIVRERWLAADLPPAGDLGLAANRLRTHILVEVTPHDGALAGDRVGANNNISSREVTFAAVQILDGTGAALPETLRVRRDGSAANQTFRINLDDTVGYFRVGRVRVVGRRYAESGAIETVEYSWTGGPPAVWGSNPAAPTWFTVNAPTLTVNPAAGPPRAGNPAIAEDDETNIRFTGTFAATTLYERVEIELILESHNGVRLLEVMDTVIMAEAAVGFNDLDVVDPNAPSLYAFADMAGLTQAEAKAFGPVDTKKFRATSGFTAAAGTKAYAVASGEVMVQRVWKAADDAGGYEDGVVNLILKPFYAPQVGTREVKYFVYRGIRLTDILKSKDAPADVRDDAGSPEFIAALYRYQRARRAAFLATDYGQAHQAEAPPATLTSVMLGWDPAVASATDLDPAFFGSDTAPQLPIVTAGMSFGEFAAGVDCGFEVVLESNRTGHKYDFARRKFIEVDVTADAADSLQLRAHREEVLRYVDPAAYYGTLFAIGVYARNGAGKNLKKEAALYTDVMSPFFTKSRLYVDIRNEVDASFDFYKAYAEGGNHLKYGQVIGKLKGKQYPTKGWPVFIIDRKQADRAVDKIYLSLSTKGNPRPALFIEEGEPVTAVDGKSFVVDGKLIATGAKWTKEVGLKVNQHTVGGNKEDIGTIYLMHYGRRVDPARVWPADSTVVKFQQYTDSVFGPINTLVPWNTDPANIKTKWVRLNDLRFVDGVDTDPAMNFGSIAERGAAFQQGQVLFFNVALEYFKRNAGAPNVAVGIGLEGGFSPQPNLMAASSLFASFDIVTLVINDTPAGGGAAVPVTTVRLASRDGVAVPESVLLLGLAEAEFNTLLGVAGGLSDHHPKNIVLKEELPVGGATHQNDGTNDYHRYTVELRGLDANGKSADVAPGVPIRVFSVDGLVFVSNGFDSAQLIPATYTPDAEESRSMSKPEPEARIAADTTLADQLNLFVNGVNQISPTSGTAKADLQSLVLQYAPDILTQARTFTYVSALGDTHHDDRPLYWARLRMAIALKSHPYLMKNPADRDQLVHDLEWLSRGLDGVSFAGAAGRRRILLVGTDPVGLNVDLAASNPAGVVALALDEEQVSGTSVNGYIRSVILPMRYRDYNQGLVDQFFAEFLYQNEADMVVLLSQNGTMFPIGASQCFELDAYAARKRGANRDNNDQIDATPVGAGAGWKEFYPTSLPVDKMMLGQTAVAPQVWYLDQSYTQSLLLAAPTGTQHPFGAGPNEELVDTTIAPSTAAGWVSETGSAGDFLPNEIFYRLARLRDVPLQIPLAPSHVPIGHLSIPAPTAGRTMTNIITRVSEMLGRAMNGL